MSSPRIAVSNGRAAARGPECLRPSPKTLARIRSIAGIIRQGFDTYWLGFASITRRAKSQFELCNWARMQNDAQARLQLYGQVVREVTADVKAQLGRREQDLEIWARVKAVYAAQITEHDASEIAETFFNSITRQVFATIGVDPAIEFVDFTFERMCSENANTPYQPHKTINPLHTLLRHILGEYAFAVPYQDIDRDARRVSQRIEEGWEAGAAPMPPESIEMLRPVFYRRKGAYIVGRVRGGNRVMPLVIALANSEEGVYVNAALVTEDDISIVFSFTRSYFHVDVECPTELIAFLRSLMPRKPMAELYNALGFNKHGKTELYRNLCRRVTSSNEKFQFAPGTPGMVMIVFTMPGFDVVFKVIRDTFQLPKRTWRSDVRRRYQLVFEHDRAGRLVDAQEFEHLAFPRHAFSGDLLEELTTFASRSVTATGNEVRIVHLYTERLLKPLDLYLRDADAASRERALMDYGQAVRDLAATGIFPGDLLFKNFGVTRHGRVTFYDYDELCLLRDCVFREIPRARYPEDEMAAEPWFHVGPNDVFPEEFMNFMALALQERRSLERAHGVLFRPEFWRHMQERHAAAELVDIYPFAPERRFDR